MIWYAVSFLIGVVVGVAGTLYWIALQLPKKL